MLWCGTDVTFLFLFLFYTDICRKWVSTTEWGWTENIRIFNGREVRIENSVTVQHHEACQTVIPSDGIFNSNRTTITDYFSCIHFFRQLLVGLSMCCFINFTLKYLHFFRSRNIRFDSFLIRWRRNVWRKLKWKWRQYVKNDVKISTSSYWRHARESSYTPLM